MSSNYLINLFSGYNIPAPGANTNIIATSLVPKRGVGALRFQLVVAAGTVFNLITTDGTTTFTIALLAGATTVAGQLYKDTIACVNGLSYNFQVATNGVIRMLQVDEIDLGIRIG